MNELENSLILIVDDNPQSLQMLGNILREHDYKAVVARSGFEALEFVQKRQPACILLDILMPEMDGIETCRRLKADEQSKDIPVIFLTGIADPWNKVQAFEVGGVDFITKPFEAKEVLVRVATHSNIRKMQMQLCTQNKQLQQEIRERQQAEIALRRLEKAVETTQVGITIADTEGKIIYTNPADAALHGYTVEELLGQPSAIFAPPEKWNSIARQHLNQEHFHYWERESLNVRRDGSIFPVNLISNTIYDADGQGIGTVTVCEDITARKKIEEELKQAKQSADMANRAKSLFLANMSHELRTPLNGVLGYAQILQHTPDLPEKHREGLKVIEQSGYHLLTLINDVLDLSKIEAGKVEIHPEPFSLQALLLTLSSMIQMKAARKGIEFREEIAPDLPPHVLGDETRLQQVLLNLLGNAIKFTEQGNVTLNVEKVERLHELHESSPQHPNNPKTQQLSNSATQNLRFEVSDTGIGIPAEKLPELFNPFQQVHDPQLNIEGTGLGLAISQRIVTLMGGQIFVESTPGQGSRFWFEIAFPVIDPDSVEPMPPDRKIVGLAGPSRKILVVDDQPDNYRLLYDMLSPLGFRLAEARSGAEALQQLAIFQPDLMLLDLKMPEIDGFEVARSVRAGNPATSNPALRQVKIIALSASAFDNVRQQSLAAGCNDFLTKPVRKPELLEALTKHLAIQWQYAEPTPPEDQISMAGLNSEAG